MHRGSLAVATALIVALLAAGCATDEGDPNDVGPCTIGPGAVCRDMDLRNVSLVAADLRGADFSGSDLRGSDIRDADLSGAKFVGALLGGVDFAGASLKNADLTKANLFGTNLANADMSGVNRTGIYACSVVEPNGRLVDGDCPAATAAELALLDQGAPPTGPPSVDYLRLLPPGRCLNDAAGPGIEVEYRVKNSTGVTFAVDGIRIESASKPRGVKRLPFVCDGKDHTVVMRVFGAPSTPTVTESLTAALDLSAPIAPVE